MKTDQEILEQLKGSSNNESRRNVGLVAFVVLLAIVIGVFTAVNNRSDDNNTDENSSVAAEESSDNEANENSSEEYSEELTLDGDMDDESADSEDADMDGDSASEDADQDNETSASVDTSTVSETSFSLEATTGSSHTDSEYTETAQVGEGVTHLARRAAHTYMSDMGITDISREQRVYIEDYLSKMNTPSPLDVSNTRTFQSSQIEEAISMARALTPAELTNLEQYSALVSVY